MVAPLWHLSVSSQHVSCLLAAMCESATHMVKSLTLNPYMSVLNLKLCSHSWSTDINSIHTAHATWLNRIVELSRMSTQFDRPVKDSSERCELAIIDGWQLTIRCIRRWRRRRDERAHHYRDTDTRPASHMSPTPLTPRSTRSCIT